MISTVHVWYRHANVMSPELPERVIPMAARAQGAGFSRLRRAIDVVKLCCFSFVVRVIPWSSMCRLRLWDGMIARYLISTSLFHSHLWQSLELWRAHIAIRWCLKFSRDEVIQSRACLLCDLLTCI